jgi:hypothetical protein
MRNAIYREARAHRRTVNEEIIALLERGLLRLTFMPFEERSTE